jgi:hypothetical protein
MTKFFLLPSNDQLFLDGNQNPFLIYQQFGDQMFIVTNTLKKNPKLTTTFTTTFLSQMRLVTNIAYNRFGQVEYNFNCK